MTIENIISDQKTTAHYHHIAGMPTVAELKQRILMKKAEGHKQRKTGAKKQCKQWRAEENTHELNFT